MRQLMFIKTGTLTWREVAEPALNSPTDALVRPFIAARCDGDAIYLRHRARTLLAAGAMLHFVDDGFLRAESDPFAGPFAYGHECVAEVVSCGSEVQNFGVGDVVVVPWAVSCGGCIRCGAGLTTKCRAAVRGDNPVAAYGFGRAFGDHGGMVSDLVRVPWADAMLVAVPAEMDPMSVASASDNLADAYRTVAAHLSERPGAPVLIVGGGAKSIGLYAAGIAHALGSERVDYIDSSRTRLGMAERLGANAIERPRGARWFREGRPLLSDGYPITVDASSTTQGLQYALRAIAPGGACTGVGFYVRRGTPLPLWEMYLKSATLHIGVPNARAALPGLLKVLADGRFDPRIVTSLVASWGDAPEALLARTTKVVLRRERVNPTAV
jgi:threonine dehydrogenase-like Zn-dependent dehydrogenase